MIKPAQQDDTFLADVESTRSQSSILQLWWLGQSGFLLQWSGRRLLLDPYLSDSLTHKYANTATPHERMTERVVAPDKLHSIDVVTSSHNHTDHLDGETLSALLRVNPGMELVISEANRAFVINRLEIDANHPKGLNAGQSLTAAGFKISAVPAAHNELETDEAGRHKFLGYVIQAGPWKIYHSGDTRLYAGMEDWLRPFAVDVALLPINGHRPERRVAGNLDGPEAAALAKKIAARIIIPCHFEMFKFNTASTDDFIGAARQLAQPYRVLRAGERWDSTELDSAS